MVNQALPDAHMCVFDFGVVGCGKVGGWGLARRVVQLLHDSPLLRIGWRFLGGLRLLLRRLVQKELVASDEPQSDADPMAARQHKSVISAAPIHDISCRNHNKNIPCGL